MNNLPKRHFWEWFKRHNNEYRTLITKPKKEATYWLRELDSHLRAFHKFFGATLAFPDNGPAKLTVTVNGNSLFFKKVDAFVASAPVIPGWEFRALEGPVAIDFMMEKQIRDTGIHPEQFYFAFNSDHPNDNSLTIYHPLCTLQNTPAILQIAFGAIYNLLGERFYGLHIQQVIAANLSTADADKLYELREIADILSWRGSTMTVDQHGILQQTR